MDDKSDDYHINDQWNQNYTRHETKDQEDGTKKFRKNHQLKRKSRSQSNGIGKGVQPFAKIGNLCPSVGEQHRRCTHPQNQQCDVSSKRSTREYKLLHVQLVIPKIRVRIGHQKSCMSHVSW